MFLQRACWILAWGIHEHPVGVFLFVFETLVSGTEVAFLDWFLTGLAMHAQDLAGRPLHQPPACTAADRVRINLAQIALCRRIARIGEQIFQRRRIAPGHRRRIVVVGLDSLPELVSDEQQLLLFLALRRRNPDIGSRCKNDPHQQNNHQQPQIGETRCMPQASPVLIRLQEMDSRSRSHHHTLYSVPSRACPGAPLLMSKTPPFSAVSGAMTSHVWLLPVIGSAGRLRKYFLLTKSSSIS